MNRFTIPTTVYSGSDALDRLRNFRNKKIWIVCDAFLAHGAAYDRLCAALTGNQLERYSDIKPDPNVATVVAGMEKLLAFNPDVVIGFGGGSAIDAAKAMVYFSRQQGLKIERCVAIPTTSGTGSEVTCATVITDEKRGIKYPLFNDQIFPDIAILDPQFIVTVPANITANTGMDVLTHALEAYVANNADDFSDALAEKATRMVFKYLPLVYQHGDCLIDREKMHNASTLAGMAFSQSGLGLNHAIAHQLGGLFHIPHGLANALLLCEVIRFNAREDIRARKRYARLARLCQFCNEQTTPEAAVNQLINRIVRLKKQVGIAKNLRALNISRQQVMTQMDALVRAAQADNTMQTTPFTANEQQIRHIVEALL